MKAITKYGLFLATFVIGAAMALSSCGKVEDSKAEITVLDSASGLPISGATVVLKPESSINNPPDYQWDEFPDEQTDSKGVATFFFNDEYKEGQAGLLVLTIDVIVNGVEYEDVGIIKIEEEKTAQKTVSVP